MFSKNKSVAIGTESIYQKTFYPIINKNPLKLPWGIFLLSMNRHRKKNMQTKLVVFDFDGTLVNPPSPDKTLIEGMTCLEYYDKWLIENNLPKRKFSGWWGRTETLRPPIFGKFENDVFVPSKELLNQELVEIHKEYYSNSGNLVILMTGRHVGMKLPNKKHVCREILDAYGLEFDEYHYNFGGKPTLTFKCETLDKILDEVPTIKEVEIYEDRMEHVSTFWDWIRLRQKEKSLN